MMLGERLGRIALAAGLGPAWAKRAYRDEQSMRLLFAFALSLESNCIDVGSNEGEVLSQIMRVAPRGRHIAYEPLPYLHHKLVRNFPNVDVREAAVSNVDGDSPFVHVKNLPSYSGFRRRRYPKRVQIETITVRTERLDDHLPVGYVPNLIKIDVEGAEYSVMQGAIRTLTRYRPIVVFECGKGASEFYGSSPKAVFDLLCNSAGLRIFDLDGNGPYSAALFTDTYDRNAHFNFVAHV